jgi:hypothetical protein
MARRLVHPPPLATLRWLLLTGLILLAGLAFCYLIWKDKLTDERILNVAVSFVVTILIASLLEWLPDMWRRFDSVLERGRFLKFFGTAAANEEVRLVFAHRVLKKTIDANPWDHHKSIPLLDGKEPWPEGVKAWVSFQDLRGAANIASEIARQTGRAASFVHDKDVDLQFDEIGYSAISFGLGFNAFTDKLSVLTDKELFAVDWGDPPRASFGDRKTDQIRVPGIGVLNPPDDYKDYAVLARVAPKQRDGKPSRYYFVCAGRTASGTAAAGRFLAYDWQKLLALYKREGCDLSRDSMMVIIEHAYDEGTLSDVDQTAKIATRAGAPWARWHRTRD